MTEDSVDRHVARWRDELDYIDPVHEAVMARLMILSRHLTSAREAAHSSAGLPRPSFKILLARDRVSLAINPFRTDTHPGVQTGVAMITGADEAIAAHQRVAEASWREAVKGPAGAARLRQMLNVVSPVS